MEDKFICVKNKKEILKLNSFYAKQDENIYYIEKNKDETFGIYEDSTKKKHITNWDSYKLLAVESVSLGFCKKNNLRLYLGE